MPSKTDTAMLRRLSETLTCTICSLALLEAVAFPKCLHIFCKNCIKGKNGKIRCKKCDNECHEEELIKIPIVSDIMDAAYNTGFADDTRNFIIGGIRKPPEDTHISTTHENPPILKEKEGTGLRRSLRIKRKREQEEMQQKKDDEANIKKKKAEETKQEKVIKEKEHVGKRVGIYWSGDKRSYFGKIVSHNNEKGYRVQYDDGEVHYEQYDPKTWTFEEPEKQSSKEESVIIIARAPE